MTDSQGSKVDFKNTIIILTSNLGSDYILDGISSDGVITQEARDQVSALLKRQFRPEFLNRLDEIVFYKPLGKTEISAIVDLMVEDLQKRLKEQQLSIELTPEAKDYVVNEGYDPVYGARPLRRFLQQKLETLIARKIIAEDLQPGTTLVVQMQDGKLDITEKDTVRKAEKES